MTVELTGEALALIEDVNLAHFVTLMKDGSPQVTPVWVDYDGRHILINTAEGRQKPRNLERDPRVALSIADRNGGQVYVQIRGQVVEVTKEGATAHMVKLGKKYRGPDFEYPGGENRLIVRILPEHVSVGYGGRPARR